MAADEIHVNDVGLVLEGTITDGWAVDVSAATTPIQTLCRGWYPNRE